MQLAALWALALVRSQEAGGEANQGTGAVTAESSSARELDREVVAVRTRQKPLSSTRPGGTNLWTDGSPVTMACRDVFPSMGGDRNGS